ncbi:MAG: nuclear transport factor 2 family protein [Deltaproteobacteria bacterium]|nr:nuclear transport factor 2 family protein [Deltaproteobacteria bacterium]
MTALDAVQRQFDAYNARDIEAFMSAFSDSIAMFELGGHSPIASGREAVRARYVDLFARSPNLRAHLVSRMALGGTVVDHERIEGRLGSSEPLELIMVYEVRDGLIQRSHIIRG